MTESNEAHYKFYENDIANTLINDDKCNNQYISPINGNHIMPNISASNNIPISINAPPISIISTSIDNHSFYINQIDYLDPQFSSTPCIKPIISNINLKDLEFSDMMDIKNVTYQMNSDSNNVNKNQLVHYNISENLLVNNGNISKQKLGVESQQTLLKSDRFMNTNELQTNELRSRLENIIIENLSKDENDDLGAKINFSSNISNDIKVNLNNDKNIVQMDVNLNNEIFSNNIKLHNKNSNVISQICSSTDLKTVTEPEFQHCKDTYRSLSESERYELPSKLNRTYNPHQSKNINNSIIMNSSKNDANFKLNSSFMQSDDLFNSNQNLTLRSEDKLDITLESTQQNSFIEDVHADFSNHSDDYIDQKIREMSLRLKTNKMAKSCTNIFDDEYVDLPQIHLSESENFNDFSIDQICMVSSKNRSQKLIPYMPQGSDVLYYLEKETGSNIDCSTIKSSYSDTVEKRNKSISQDLYLQPLLKSFSEGSQHITSNCSTNDLNIINYLINKDTSLKILDSSKNNLNDESKNPNSIINKDELNIKKYNNTNLYKFEDISINDALILADNNIKENKIILKNLLKNNEVISAINIKDSKYKGNNIIDDNINGSENLLIDISDMENITNSENKYKFMHNDFINKGQKNAIISRSGINDIVFYRDIMDNGSSSAAFSTELQLNSLQLNSLKCGDNISDSNCCKDDNVRSYNTYKNNSVQTSYSSSQVEDELSLNRHSLNSALNILKKALARQMEKYKKIREEEIMWKEKINYLHSLIKDNKSQKVFSLSNSSQDLSAESSVDLNIQLNEAYTHLKNCIAESVSKKQLICKCLHHVKTKSKQNKNKHTKCNCHLSKLQNYKIENPVDSKLKAHDKLLNKENFSDNIPLLISRSIASQTTPRLQNKSTNMFNFKHDEHEYIFNNKKEFNDIDKYSSGDNQFQYNVTGSLSWFVELLPKSKANNIIQYSDKILNIQKAPSIQEAFESKMGWFKENSKTRQQLINHKNYLQVHNQNNLNNQKFNIRQQIRCNKKSDYYFNKKNLHSGFSIHKNHRVQNNYALLQFKKREELRLNKERLKNFNKKVLNQILNRN